ncbi:MAG: thiosulfate oxidation carrier protein SoxY [bacterium]
MKRREFNKSLVALTGLGAGVSLGALPLSVFAAWPQDAFDADTADAVTQALYGSSGAEASDAITFKAPDIAENGAVVPISLKADIDNTDSVAIMVANNPSPLTVTFEMMNPGKADVGTRIKMGKTSQLVALVRADGKLYTATSSEVKVTIGGCGG